MQGIYFSVITFLTIGFGDFYPTKNATKIVLFPFALVGIVQVAALVDMFVRFFHQRVTSQHSKRRYEYERCRQEEQDELEKEPDLEHELMFLRNLYRKTDHLKTLEDLGLNITGFLAFWVIGALIFSQIEVNTIFLHSTFYLAKISSGLGIWRRAILLLCILLHYWLWRFCSNITRWSR